MKQSIGILGGMGPLATADLFAKIVNWTEAACDNDHVRVCIDSNSAIADRTAAILSGGKDPVPEMESALRHLEACGVSCIVMPCNTAHYFLPRLRELTQTPMLNMLEETAKSCAARYPGQVAGILATRGTLQTGLYTQALAQQGIESIMPDEAGMDALMAAIYDGVKKGAPLEPFRHSVEALLTQMRAEGASYFILGCTELPILQQTLALAGTFVDPGAEVAKAAIRFCGYRVKEEMAGK